MKTLKFTKMQGLGNDFVVLDGISERIEVTADLAKKLANRHFGVGCDQILLVEKSDKVDFKYRIWNQDGGEVEQCGNGARCFAKFVREKGLTGKDEITVETKKGIIILKIDAQGMVTVDMGAPIFEPTQIPFNGSADIIQPIDVGEAIVEVSAVSMGNPHAVQVVLNVDAAPVEVQGPIIERYRLFPERVNAGFMQVVDRSHIRLRVYERGVGETLACGTGACAAAVTGIRRGLLDSPVQVAMKGGELTISWDKVGSVFMSGPAETVFQGEINL